MRTSILLLLALLAAAPCVAQAAPPSGRPPVGALRRYEPRLYEVKFEVALTTVSPLGNPADVNLFDVEDAPIILPVIYQGAYSKTFPNSENGGIILDSGPLPNPPRTIDEGKPFHTHHLRMVLPKYIGQSIRWSVTYTTQTWSAAIDENLAQQSTWPRDGSWPDEVADALKPQMYIESDNQAFAAIIAQNGGSNLRTISPYIAAKQIVGFVLNNFQIIGAGVTRRAGGTMEGFQMHGALKSIENAGPGGKARGSEHDLVCLCVALLRAANIPARPVIGASDASGKTEMLSWAEFFLNGSGWVAFDPKAMLGSGSGKYRNLTGPWDEFGSMDELNERVILSYHFHPPASVQATGSPAIWGWDPRKPQKSYEQAVAVQITNKGRGEEDPR